MSILGDIVNIRGALQQQKLASALDPLQIQQAQLQMQMMQNPEMWKALGNVNGLLGGQPDQSQQPPQQPSQPTTGGLLQHLATGATGAINAAQPGGGLLSLPPQQGGLLGGQTTQSPTGPVSSFGLGNAPSAGQPPAQASQPSQQQGPDPFEIIRQAQPLLGSPFPALKARGEGAVAYANSLLQNDPRYVTRKAAAGGILAQDQYLVDNASTPAQRQAAQTKYETDAGQLRISNNTGAVTSVGIPQPNFSTTNPEQGTLTTQNGQTLLPGATQTRGAIAAAQAGGAEAGKAPYDMVSVQDQSGNSFLVPKSSLLPHSTPGSTQPAGTSGPALSEVGPGREKILAGQGEAANETVKEYQDQAEGGTQMLAQIDQLRAAASQFGPGKFANVRGEFLNLLNSSGLITKDQVNSLGSYQEGTKIGIQLQAAVTKQLGSREAAQVFGVMGRSIPNLTMSQDGLDKVTGYLSGIARYNQARAEYAQNQASSGNVAGVNSTRQTFINNSNPSYYILASMSPQTRTGFLAQLGPQRANALIDSWKKAAVAGYAPAQPY